MKLVVVDVETDGPMPPDYSIVCFGAVIVEDGLFRSFEMSVGFLLKLECKVNLIGLKKI